MKSLRYAVPVVLVLVSVFLIVSCAKDRGGDQMKAGNTTLPCTGKVKKTKRGADITLEKLSCTGTCPDGTACTWQSTRDHHGSTREWCGCGPTEPTDECFLVFYTPGQGVGGGPPEVICPPRDCNPGKQCKPKETLVASGGGVELYDITCGCQ